MANIYDELKHLVSSDLVGKLAGKLGGNTSHSESAVKSLLPTLLAKFMTKSDSPAVHGVLQDAGKLHLPGVDHLLEGGGKKPSLGEKFISAVMGSQEGALHTMVEKSSGLSADHAKSLTAGVGAVMAGFLGKRMLQHGNADHVMNELSSEKNSILAAVPAEWRDKFHLTPDTMHCAAPQHHKAAAHSTTHHKATTHHEPPKKKKKSLAWLWWLLGLIVLALLLCLLLGKGCHKKVEPVVEEVLPPVEVVANTYDLTLPTGESLTIRKGGMLDKMVTFLRSDEYKNGDEDVMRKHWFEFEDVDFKFDSSTEFENGNTAINQVENRLAFLLKYFPDAKLRFGGNADHRGREGYNEALSVARAETLKNLLVAKGIPADRVTTRGFGEENAVIPATATDAERAPDRDFAVRFQK